MIASGAAFAPAAELRAIADKLDAIAEELDPGGRLGPISPLGEGSGGPERRLQQLASICSASRRGISCWIFSCSKLGVGKSR